MKVKVRYKKKDSGVFVPGIGEFSYGEEKELDKAVAEELVKGNPNFEIIEKKKKRGE